MNEVQSILYDSIEQELGKEFLSDFNVVPLLDAMGGIYLQPKDELLAKSILRASTSPFNDRYGLMKYMSSFHGSAFDTFNSLDIRVDVTIDNLVVMPNPSYDEFIDHDLIDSLMGNGSHTYIKPHYSTTNNGQFRRGVVDKSVSPFKLIAESDVIYTTIGSDVSLYSTLMGKKTKNLIHRNFTMDNPTALLDKLIGNKRERLVTCINNNSGIFLFNLNGHADKSRIRQFRDCYFRRLNYEYTS